MLLWCLPLWAAAGWGECPPQSRAVAYTLSIPEPGLDDFAAYEGYRTRLFRDAADNTFQIYLKQREGRVVHLWADAANESVAFTVRDSADRPVQLAWLSDSTCVSSSRADRSIEYTLVTSQREIWIGHLVLGSMRVERDIQYAGLHLQPFAAPFVQPELRELVDQLTKLAEPERRRHLMLLKAGTVEEVSRRLAPSLRLLTKGARRVARVEQPSLDARTRLLLELSVPTAEARLQLEDHVLRVRASSDRPLMLTVRITTDAAPLTPLRRTEIFNREFLSFHDSLRSAHDRALAEQPSDAGHTPSVLRFRLLERQVRGVELLSSREKIFAGLPNFATYFGRDMLVTGLLMQSIWSSAMSEHVIGSVLRKLSPNGEVSHEEALGGQSIREHAQEYSALINESLAARAAGDAAGATRMQQRAAGILERLAQVRENYSMVDDEFQLPVLVAKYLADRQVPGARKRAFLTEAGGADTPASRLSLLLRNLMLVADLTAAYVRQPSPENLVSFPPRSTGGYQAASWRDSGAGYGGGRFAMDVNVIWVPRTLEAIDAILGSLRSLSFTTADLERAAPALRGSVLGTYAHDPAALRSAIQTWRGTARHFIVRLSVEEADARIARRLATLPNNEAQYWRGVLRRTAAPEGGLEFLAVSLDATGEPIGIANTDVATRWFLDDITGAVLGDPTRAAAALRELAVTVLPYPRGLFVECLGPVVANDAFATPDVWEAFRRDEYHSPRVVWGREVNLLLLGLMRQITAAYDDTWQLRDGQLSPYVAALEAALRQTLAAVEESGLKHNELWSYRIEADRLQPVRYGNSSDLQLWNLSNLVVEFLTDREYNRIRHAAGLKATAGSSCESRQVAQRCLVAAHAPRTRIGGPAKRGGASEATGAGKQ